MLFLKLLDLKIKAAIVVAVAFLVAYLLVSADSCQRSAVRTLHQSRRDMKVLRDWRLK